MLRKSIVALLLVLVATYVPCYALQGTWWNLTWQLSKDSTVLVISGTGYMKESFAPVDMDIAETKEGLSIDGKPCMFVLTDVLPTAIEDIHATATNREVQSIYSLEAQKEPSTRKGINIVRYNDGSSQKIMIK